MNIYFLLFFFIAPQDVRLLQRLRQVCKQEGLHVGNSAYLSELCTATGHDIRASINNLQFAALKSIQQQSASNSAGADVSTGGNWGASFGKAKGLGEYGRIILIF